MSTPIALHTTTLGNGLSVCVNEDPGAPAVAVNLWVDVGSFDEVPGRTGFAHLFEHLMFQGSANVEPGEHMALIEAYGGTVNATTSSERTNYFATVPPGALDLLLWLEADRLASLNISAENFEAQRAVVKEEKRQRYDNQPYGDLLELLISQFYGPEHPYGHLPIGSMADLDAASLDDVQAFFETWYHPGNMRLVICGNVTTQHALDLAERHLGALPARTGTNLRNRTDIPRPERSDVTVHRDVPHDLGYASWPMVPTDDPRWLATELAISALADGHTSQLYRTLVKGSGLALEAHASTLGHLRDESIATVMARPAPGVTTATALAEAVNVLDRFASDGPSGEELQRAKAQYERDWLLDLSSVTYRADTLQETWATFGDPTRISDRVAELEAITAADIQQAATILASQPPSTLHYLTKES